MARRYITELQEGELVEEVFLVRSKELREARNASLFIKAELCDRSGGIEARMWDVSDKVFESFKTNDFVKVRGRVETFQGKQQLRIDAIRYVEDSTVDMSEFLASTSEDCEELLRKLIQWAQEIGDEHLRKLALSFLEDAEFVERLKRTPAATSHHHAYLGGLLEHTARVVELADVVSKMYPVLDRDIMLAGAILHDIGKVEELAADRMIIYTDRGQLLGHIVLGVMMVEERASGIDGFPRGLLDLLEHALISHHGELEYGSPKLPVTREAIALHHLDNIDAKISGFSEVVSRDSDESSTWTAWSKMFQTRLYKGPAEKAPEQ